MYVSRALARIVARVFKKNGSVKMPSMVANDIDVYHGQFGDGKLIDFRNYIDYIDDVNGLDVPINTVKCSNISAESFLTDDNLNATVSCLHVKSIAEDSTGGKQVKFTIHVRPWLRQLLLRSISKKRIEVVNPCGLDNPATTCVRDAYKSMQMKIKLNLVKLGDPAVGTLVKSQKAKVDKMKGWCDYPVPEYWIKPIRNYFILEKKHKAINCGSYARRTHIAPNMLNRRYRACCIAFMSKKGNINTCKVKDHSSKVHMVIKVGRNMKRRRR